MRTKTLLLTAVLGAAGIVSTMAQVYSVNAVGYVNVNLPKGYSLIANPLNNGQNKLTDLIPTAPDSSVVYKWVGAGFDVDPPNYIDGFGWFNGDIANYKLNPGDGFFIYVPAATPVTFVGEVPQGNLANPLPVGYSIKASQVPQAGTLTQLGFAPAMDDFVYQWKGADQSYDPNPPQYFGAEVGWFPAEPTLGVGEAFFLFRTGAAGSWNRTFSVNN
jgi:hypothetical protein